MNAMICRLLSRFQMPSIAKLGINVSSLAGKPLFFVPISQSWLE